MGVLAVLIILVLLGWLIFTQVGGRQQVSVLSPHDVADTRKLVGNLFGIAWSRVPGRGDENYKPRLRMYAPTLSVSYEQAASGTEVQLWCSSYITRMGLMGHAQLMWRKKRSVARSLAQPSRPLATSAAPALPGDQPQNLGGIAQPAEGNDRS